jgi:transcriptional regulator with XRE-family HTH domain
MNAAPRKTARKRKDAESLGDRVKVLRSTRGITLERLATATGLTKSYLSKIENSHKVPPIATLSRIAQALGTGISIFFGDIAKASKGASVVRRDERLPIVRGGTAFGYDYVSLAHKRLSKRMDPFIFTFPSRIDHHVFFEHGGEEFVLILSGKVVFQVGDERWTLEEGDTIYFDASTPHRSWSIGRSAKALVVVHAAEEDVAAPRRRTGAKKRAAII